MPDYYIFHAKAEAEFALLFHPSGDSVSPITAADAVEAATFAAGEWGVEAGESLWAVPAEAVERLATVPGDELGPGVVRRSGLGEAGNG